jgi:hypothetical protein
VAHDLAACGISAAEVRSKMDELLVQAACQIAAEG